MGIQSEAITTFSRLANDLSLFIIMVGVRGSGKTLLMTHFECELLRQIYAILRLREVMGSRYLPNRKVNAWSNYPVKRLDILPITGKRIYLEPKPLDIEKLIVWHEEYENGIIFFDEIDQVADRQDWMSTVSKMLNAGVQVMRHRNLSFFTSVQSINWLNARLQWQADIIIKCRDLAFTPWGRSSHLRPGEVSELTWIDKSGIMTGRSYEEYPITYSQLFFGKRYWNNYKTQHEYSVTEARTKYKIKPQVKEIDLSGEEEEIAEWQAIINFTIDFFRYGNPGEEIRSDVFWAKAEECSFPQEQRIRGGRLLKKMGVVTRQSGGYGYYTFDGVVAV